MATTMPMGRKIASSLALQRCDVCGRSRAGYVPWPNPEREPRGEVPDYRPHNLVFAPDLRPLPPRPVVVTLGGVSTRAAAA